MDTNKLDQIFTDTAYIRMGGTAEELKCAKYLQEKCAELGLEAHLEAFDVQGATMKKCQLLIDGKEIPCKGYFNAGSAEVEAPFYYLRANDKYSLSQCKGKIVMMDGRIRYWSYKDLMEHGAVGFITYDGNALYADEDIEQRDLREEVHQNGKKLPCVYINTKKAIEIVKSSPKMAKIVLEQDEYVNQSHNVILDLPGEVDEYILFTAHYDTTSNSVGAYDNMSGCIGLLGIAEKFAKESHRYGLRFVWCGSEESGLLGSRAYANMHEEELKNCVLNINLDMIGCIMGNFIACVTAEQKLVHFIEYFCNIKGFDMKAKQDVYASDSTPIADKGVPALSFARIAPDNTAKIHVRYDTVDVMSNEQLLTDINFINSFVDVMANAKQIPVSRKMPDNMIEKLDIYNCRKRA